MQETGYLEHRMCLNFLECTCRAFFLRISETFRSCVKGLGMAEEQLGITKTLLSM